MRRPIFYFTAILTFMLIVPAIQAQDNGGKLDFSVGSDFVSRYVWRGTQFSSSPSFQPGAALTYGNLTFGAWGSYSYNGQDGAETDFYLSYTALNDMLTISFTDYFFPNETIANNNYFEYDEDKTAHIYEASLSFNGTDNLPISLLVAANVYGADAKKINDDETNTDFNTEDGNQYSTYIELGYSTKVKETDLNLFAGFTPNDAKDADPDKGYIGETGFYGNTMGFVNIGATGSKEVKISDKFSLPVSMSVITNPMNENIFFVFGFSL